MCDAWNKRKGHGASALLVDSVEGEDSFAFVVPSHEQVVMVGHKKRLFFYHGTSGSRTLSWTNVRNSSIMLGSVGYCT